MLTGPQLDTLQELHRRAIDAKIGRPVSDAVCRELRGLGLAYELRPWQWRPTPEGMAAVLVQASQLLRTLATVGVADLQLAQLGCETLDDALRLELSLLTQEALWQLRALKRQTKRRWRLGDEPAYPAPLQAWLALQVNGADSSGVHRGGRHPSGH